MSSFSCLVHSASSRSGKRTKSSVLPYSTGAERRAARPCDDASMRLPSTRAPRKDALRNRERVLGAALELVRRDGEGVPMAQIAELAGVGVGTVYRHFP